MNKVDAMVYADEIAKSCCIKKQRRHKQPVERPLKDFGKSKEGYCVFCEDYRSYISAIQHCVMLFVRTRELDKEEIGNDLIIF